MRKPRTYWIRYLAPKQAGYGEIVHVMSSDKQITLEDYKRLHPQVFDKLGFYTLATISEAMTVENNNGKITQHIQRI